MGRSRIVIGLVIAAAALAGCGSSSHTSSSASSLHAAPPSGLEVYELERPDFAEAYLVAQAEATGVNQILSFDRSIDRLPAVPRLEP